MQQEEQGRHREGRTYKSWRLCQLDTLKQFGHVEHALPTLAERIDHLESLLKAEIRQGQAFQTALPPAPPSSSTTLR